MKKLKNLINELKIANSKQITNPYSLEALFKIIAIYLTPLFYYLKINANQLTWIHFITSASGAIIILVLGYDYYVYGVTLYILGIMIDFCDGSIARISNTATFYGRFLDGLLDVVKTIMMQSSLLIIIYNNVDIIDKLFYGLSNTYILALCVLSVGLTPIHHLIYDRYSALARWANDENSIKIFPTLRYVISFKTIDFFVDLQNIFLVLIIFSLDFIVHYFIVVFVTSIYVMFIHIYYSKKYMSINASDHRDIKS